jgi:hypothetical protein
MANVETPTTQSEPEHGSSQVLTDPADQKLYDIQHSHAPFPVISALITLLATAGFRNVPEALPFIAVGGATATVIFTAEYVKTRISNRRRTTTPNASI